MCVQRVRFGAATTASSNPHVRVRALLYIDHQKRLKRASEQSTRVCRLTEPCARSRRVAVGGNSLSINFLLMKAASASDDFVIGLSRIGRKLRESREGQHASVDLLLCDGCDKMPRAAMMAPPEDVVEQRLNGCNARIDQGRAGSGRGPRVGVPFGVVVVGLGAGCGGTWTAASRWAAVWSPGVSRQCLCFCTNASASPIE